MKELKEFDDIFKCLDNISTSKKNPPLNTTGSEKNIFTCIYPKILILSP